MVNDFVTWLNNELEKRAWSRADLSRKAKVSQSALSLVVSGQRAPGMELCEAIAHAMGYPPETVFRAAGLLPPDPEMTPDIAAVIQAMSGLPESWQAKLADDARKMREFYEHTEAERLEKERLAARKKTGPLPDLS